MSFYWILLPFFGNTACIPLFSRISPEYLENFALFVSYLTIKFCLQPEKATGSV